MLSCGRALLGVPMIANNVSIFPHEIYDNTGELTKTTMECSTFFFKFFLCACVFDPLGDPPTLKATISQPLNYVV